MNPSKKHFMTIKKYCKNLLLFSLLIWQHFLLCAQENEKIAILKVSASGKTKESAIQNALRSAIEQSFGTYLTSKTVISNDNMVSDEIVSIANGNIKKYTILSETVFFDTAWSVFLLAEVSIDKLQQYVQSKGYEVEFQGGLFSLNINQQILNEKSEIKAVDNLMSVVHSLMQNAFDYKIVSDQPISLDPQSKNWQIKHTVKAIANNNLSICAEYLTKNLSYICMKDEEIQNYKSLNKKYYTCQVRIGTIDKSFYLRRMESILILNTIVYQFEYYTRKFFIKSDVSEHYGFDFSNNDREDKWKTVQQVNSTYRVNSYRDPRSYDNFRIISNGLKIVLKPVNETVDSFIFRENLSLEQISKIKSIKVHPNTINTDYKNGGFVIYENDSIQVVISPQTVSDKFLDNNGLDKVIHFFTLSDIDLNPTLDFQIHSSKLRELVGKRISLLGFDDWKIPNSTSLEFIGLILLTEKYFGMVGLASNSYLLGYDDISKRTIRTNPEDNYKSTPETSDCNCYLKLIRVFRK